MKLDNVRSKGSVRFRTAARKYLGFCLLFVSLLYLSGCTGTTAATVSPTPSGPSESTQSTGTPLPSISPSPSPTPVVQIKGTNNWYYKNGRGYSYTMTITTYKPVEDAKSGGTVHPEYSGAKLMSSNFNPKTDLVVPASVKITNTTDKFDIKVVWACTILSNQSASLNKANVVVDQCASSGNQSTALSSSVPYINFVWTDPVTSQKSVNGYFFIIIKDYYSPDYPNGQSTLLNQMTLRPYPSCSLSHEFNTDTYIEKSLTDKGITLNDLTMGYDRSPMGMTLSGTVINGYPN